MEPPPRISGKKPMTEQQKQDALASAGISTSKKKRIRSSKWRSGVSKVYPQSQQSRDFLHADIEKKGKNGKTKYFTTNLNLAAGKALRTAIKNGGNKFAKLAKKCAKRGRGGLLVNVRCVPKKRLENSRWSSKYIIRV